MKAMRFFDPVKQVWREGDPNKSACLLDNLEGCNAISLDQCNAGKRFAALHRKRLGVKLWASGVSFDDVRGYFGGEESDLDKERAQKHREAYTAAREAAKAHSRKTLDAVMGVACYERQIFDADYLLAGLDLLALHFGIVEERAAA